MSTTVCCSEENKINQHRLVPLLLPITYENADIITEFELPRKYTSTHNDLTKEVYISIGHNYNQFLLNSEEALVNETQVVGKWKRIKCNKYEIHLTVLVSTEKNPQAEIRNRIFCQELGYVLEGIAFAETALLNTYKYLNNAKIFIHFKSIDPLYNRTEYWHRLGYWSPKSCIYSKYSQQSTKSSQKSSKKRSSKKTQHQRPPNVCSSCINK